MYLRYLHELSRLSGFEHEQGLAEDFCGDVGVVDSKGVVRLKRRKVSM